MLIVADYFIRYEPREKLPGETRVPKPPRGALLLSSIHRTEWAALRVWGDCKALIECEAEMKNKIGAVVLYEDTYPWPREVERAEFSFAAQV